MKSICLRGCKQRVLTSVPFLTAQFRDCGDSPDGRLEGGNAGGRFLGISPMADPYGKHCFSP